MCRITFFSITRGDRAPKHGTSGRAGECIASAIAMGASYGHPLEPVALGLSLLLVGEAQKLRSRV